MPIYGTCAKCGDETKDYSCVSCMATELRTTAGYVKAWKAICAEYRKAEVNGDINEFLCKIEELVVLYGDPNIEPPGGVMRL